jgi:hypothetical protein
MRWGGINMRKVSIGYLDFDVFVSMHFLFFFFF